MFREGIPLDELVSTIPEFINHKDFESSHIKCKSYQNIDELRNPHAYEYFHTVIILDDLKKQQLNDERFRAT